MSDKTPTLIDIINGIVIEDSLGNKTVRVTVVDTNKPPTDILLSNTSVVDGDTPGTRVGILSTVDENQNDTHTYEIITDPDDKFSIEEGTTNYLVLKNSVDFSTKQSHNVTIRSTDSTGLFFDKEFTITVVTSDFVDANSLIHNGTDEYLSAADDASLRFSTKMTAHIWLNPAGSGNRDFIAKWNAFTSNLGFLMRLDPSQVISVFISGNGTSSTQVTAPGTTPNAAWGSIGYTFNAGVVKIYRAGLPIKTQDTGIPSIFASNAEFTIGSRIDGTGARSNYYEGLSNESTLHDTDLSDAQMLELGGTLPKNPTLLTSAPNLVSWNQHGEKFASSIDPDEKGANDLTGNNMNGANISTDVPA